MATERSIPHIELRYSQLLDLVRRSPIGCDQIDSWELLSGGALNTTYKFIIGNDSYILRLYARDRGLCKTEKAIYQLINNHVSAPKMVYVDETQEPWAYAIFEFISGEHISEVPNENRVSLSYQLGSVLATIHAFKIQKAGLFGEGMTIAQGFEVGSSPYFEESLSVLMNGKCIRKRLGDQLTDEVIAFLQKNKDCFPIIENNVCLVHADFKPVNLIVNEDKVFVLDWEFAHAGVGILDFAILLRHREQFPCDIEALTKGYRDFGGVLPQDWFRSALITDFVNILTLLDSPPERPVLFHQLKNSIYNTIKLWDHY